MRYAAGLAHLAAVDADFARVLPRLGELPERRLPTGLPGLLRVIVGQQVSVHAARAIWERLQARVAAPADACAWLALDPGALRDCGLSRQKVASVTAVAQAVAGGALDLDALAAAPDDDAVAALVVLRGVGRWTAENYLIFALDRPDLWPAHDLALAEAVRRLRRLPERPGWRALDAQAEAWRPWRGVAARALWRYYALSAQPGWEAL
ncbi:DNA-3-methyladenine glycosylase II [Plasticicumulans lactativorans]|uniref:DNA-3-methyladenine glycosylase II n=1 Tax=Plasticicumulans lactativorans TaxID=1133106 RepID=A0A4R2L8Z4_9GAMM|nr:DNA-3-methyladenine glycosylase [Plasticicumulans lactativorans]TCO81786.1 DNA-3-methyladenine glycosylase II [Plasticicumulans lactativorans]